MTDMAQNLTVIGISVDDVLWIRTRDLRIEGADESTDPWWPQK